jgi:hypothetical protein
MRLLNTTPVGARLVSAASGPERTIAAVVARPTFAIDRGRLVLTPEYPWPAGPKPAETPWGVFQPDVPVLKNGIDVFVLGSAWQPHGEPATELTMAIHVGASLDRRMAVIGDRVWVRRDGVLAPGEPRQFVSMALIPQNAYGGPGTANPLGKGCYASEEDALGQPLPNLEDPDFRIRSFADRPEPVGTGPRPEGGAYPRMTIDPARAPNPGSTVEVTHASPEGALRFALPELRMSVEVRLDGREQVLPLHLDEIAVFTEPRRVFLAHRAVFEFRNADGDHGQATLRMG